MATQDHLKIASSELMKAADALRQEITELQKEEKNITHLVDKNLVALTAEMSSMEKELQATEDPNLRSKGQTSIDYLARQVAENKSQLAKDQQRIKDTIRQKESLIASLNQQAKSIMP